MNRDHALLYDILEAAKLGLIYVQDATEENFTRNQMLQDSVIRRIQIIGEAASKLTHETCDRLPEIPWKKIIGTRHILVHNYGQVDLGIVWSITKDQLPALVSVLAEFLNKPENAPPSA